MRRKVTFVDLLLCSSQGTRHQRCVPSFKYESQEALLMLQAAPPVSSMIVCICRCLKILVDCLIIETASRRVNAVFPNSLMSFLIRHDSSFHVTFSKKPGQRHHFYTIHCIHFCVVAHLFLRAFVELKTSTIPIYSLSFEFWAESRQCLEMV